MKIKKLLNKNNHRLFLTVFFSMIVFLILVITMLIVGCTFYILLKNGYLKPLNVSSTKFWTVTLLILVTSVCVGTIVAAIVSRFPLRPVYTMIAGLNRLASGDYNARINLGTIDVAAKLSDSFNTLAEELQNTEMLRSDFVNNFSHEFKTPIVSIYGFAKLLKKGNLTEEQKAEYLDIIEEESARLSAMATNVLNLTKIENQSILSNVTEYNLSEQLRMCVLLLEKKWTEKNLGISINFSEHNVVGEEELLKQVWINLIDNAIKFSPNDGTVEIGIKEDGERITVSVKNNGSPISDKDLPRIFNKFYQCDPSHSSQGNGIGLAIVKKIVTLHKGEVTVESKGNETTFYVSLPAHAAF